MRLEMKEPIMKMIYLIRTLCFSLFIFMSLNVFAGEKANTNGQSQFLNTKYSWVWGGFNLVLPVNTEDDTLQIPMYGAQFGWATSFTPMKHGRMFYGATIVDTIYSKTDVGTGKAKTSGLDAAYVFGFEQLLKVSSLPVHKYRPHLSFFLELGPGIGHRSMISKPSDSAISANSGFAFNGVANIGLNLNFNPQDKVSALIRIAARFQGGTKIDAINKYGDITAGKINLNPLLFYVPTVAFVIRWK